MATTRRCPRLYEHQRCRALRRLGTKEHDPSDKEETGEALIRSEPPGFRVAPGVRTPGHCARAARHRGVSQAQAIKATVERVGVSLAEAKSIVHLSPVWEETRPANDRLHQSLDEAARPGR